MITPSSCGGDRGSPATCPRLRLRLGPLWVDVVDFSQAVEAVEALVARGNGGMVFTPNVDHVVNAERNAALRNAYLMADLSVADGMPVVWASRLLGCPLPERIAGSDLARLLLKRAAERRWRVYFIGGSPEIAQRAANVVSSQMGVEIVGVDSPRVNADGSGPEVAETLRRLAAVKPALVFVGFGSPKQELFIHRNRDALGGAVALGLGATLGYLAGTLPRAPRWMARVGLEWSYRLFKEPRRLWRRYLVNDPRFVAILARELRRPPGERIARCV